MMVWPGNTPGGDMNKIISPSFFDIQRTSAINNSNKGGEKYE